MRSMRAVMEGPGHCGSDDVLADSPTQQTLLRPLRRGMPLRTSTPSYQYLRLCSKRYSKRYSKRCGKRCHSGLDLSQAPRLQIL